MIEECDLLVPPGSAVYKLSHSSAAWMKMRLEALLKIIN